MIGLLPVQEKFNRFPFFFFFSFFPGRVPLELFYEEELVGCVKLCSVDDVNQELRCVAADFGGLVGVDLGRERLHEPIIVQPLDCRDEGKKNTSGLFYLNGALALLNLLTSGNANDHVGHGRQADVLQHRLHGLLLLLDKRQGLCQQKYRLAKHTTFFLCLFKETHLGDFALQEHGEDASEERALERVERSGFLQKLPELLKAQNIFFLKLFLHFLLALLPAGDLRSGRACHR